MTLCLSSAYFFSRWCSWNAFKSFTFGHRVVFGGFNTFLALDRGILFLIFWVLVESLINLSCLRWIKAGIYKGIRPKDILLLSIIFQNNAHLLNFVVFLFIELQLIVEELLSCSCILFVVINLRLKGALSHLILLNFLLEFFQLPTYHWFVVYLFLVLCVFLYFGAQLAAQYLFVHFFFVVVLRICFWNIWL